ncbi:MAG: hypothetical protein A2725_02265 [Candidatus Magasanikbacteria bacterium RIFCSPHIGHO2_01_FULL_33_34]|uniref:DUF3048 domain-containing protein n=1 Tax=Candidatus Magasanikbacteria bacterium RIFCSPHIGHO2_01_FULL_33_34 TaxID=1798671 RepID=A0A1F6LKH1_9BACT|nr:MAG: hypothetical protein A2725_02265 [Candidatus Magasanikbacteria bacterium RIFCSPHIGHO2_01_FULL_33_34]OGH65652.1 MAG: hypothetical protein A3B83_02135 [Candidatus Magasanikbacteria bacterium RIFCSPHIGHO2_02_FULL_33_17]OGH75861.1 MAG: hypothetical protein A3A89_03030 [Candidatus Magasanikbacteria bacterium RIFCSPLOWO2_01_FULL_33_34]OGH81841.1 MAG: hypothetical protein A3F93_00250 [Candidatus Magasanikbacteria bacterium RIFCSPLOWO2_12_FULL_34_7]
MSKRQKIQNYFRANDSKYIYALSVVVFLFALSLMIWFLSKAFVLPEIDNKNYVEDKEVLEEIEENCEYMRKLDGICVEADRYIDQKLVAVMIENNLEAWPLSGLAEASIVYEAPVEGNIPRFMAIYAVDTVVDQVGPVRSARPYYLDWLDEYGGAMYMHVGGSPEALELIDKYEVFDINEFYRGWYFWRSTNRTAPHNTYTSTELWGKAYDKYFEYHNEEDYDGWLFQKIENCIDECVNKIDVPIAPWNSYHAVWSFDKLTQKYIRFQGGEQMFEMDGKEIYADTVIVQMVNAKVIDEIGRKEIETIGSGDVFVFRNGVVLEGKWKKESRKDRTKFYDESGDLIPLQSGKIWVEILPVDRKLEWE